MGINAYNTVEDVLPIGYAYQRMIYENGEAADFIVLQLNEKMTQIIGADSAEIINLSAAEVWERQSFNYMEWIGIFAEALKNQKQYAFQVSAEKGNKYYQIKVVPHDNEHFSVLFTDIHADENPLNLSSSILGEEISLISCFDEHGTILALNKYWNTMTGFSEEELLNTSIIHLIEPEDRSAFRRYLADLQEGAPKKTFISSMRMKNTRSCSIEWHTIKINSFIYSLAIDVTDRLEQEAIFKKLADQMPASVFQFQMNKNGEMSLPYYSKGLMEALNISTEDHSKVLDKFFGLIHPEDVKKFEDSVIISKETGEMWELEFRFFNARKEVRWLHAKSNPMYLLNGNIIWNGYITDITEEKQREIALIESEKKMRRLFSQVDGVLFQFDITGSRFHFSLLSEGIYELSGLPVEEAYKDIRTVFSKIHPEDFPNLRKTLYAAAESGTLWQKDFRIHHSDKGWRWVRGNGKPEQLNDKTVRFYGYLNDITERRKNEQALANREKLIAEFTSKVPGVIFHSISYGPNDFSFLSATGSISSILGEFITAEEIVNIGMVELIYPADRSWMVDKMNESRENLTTFNETFRIQLADGEWKWVHGSSTPELAEDGGVLYFGYMHDVTEKKKNEIALEESEKRYKKLAEKMEKMAYHDALTGLPNRRLLFDRLEQQLLQSSRTGAKVGLVFIDLDDFKLINDNFGHETGDKLLIHAAEQLRGSVRATDTVARVAGDEFMILLTNIDKDELSKVMKGLVKNLQRPFQLNGELLTIQASLGIAVYPEHGKTVDDLFKNADKAMYQKKRNEKNGFIVYERGMD